MPVLVLGRVYLAYRRTVMMTSDMGLTNRFLIWLILLLLLSGCASRRKEKQTSHFALRQALTLHAGFDEQVDADFAVGDPRIYTAASMAHRETAELGLRTENAVIPAEDKGRFGDALRFVRKIDEVVLFRGKDNFSYQNQKWSGTVSFWLSLDPNRDLEPGFSDPIQITPRKWNDGAMFVEFTKDERPRHFRLGLYPDGAIWNPQNMNWNEMSLDEKPLAVVVNPPFSRGKWTHVAFTFQNFNTVKPDGIAKLYLNGELASELSPRIQTYTWDINRTDIMIGLSYVGLFDELTLFNRALAPLEIRTLYKLKNGMGPLVQ